MAELNLNKVLSFQMGRSPRKPYRVVRFCKSGYPLVIASPPLLEDGSRFPNWTYLSCPKMVEAVSRAESAGEIKEYVLRLQEDESLRERLLAANEDFKMLRAREALNWRQEQELSAELNMAGQADVLKTKCLHAHVAHFLAHIDDPIGEELFDRFAEAVFSECAQEPFCGLAQDGRSPSNEIEEPCG